MSFPRYPEYKDCGVEWLGEVPAHWEVTPLKHLVTLRSGGTPNKDRLEYWDGDLPWASAKDLKVAVLRDTQDHIAQLAVDTGVAELIPAGSVLIVVRGMILARTFPVSIAAVPMAINQDLKALDCRENIQNSFVARLLEAATPESSRLTDEAGHGTKALRMETWTAMRLPVPPVSEQRSITTFLDHEIAKIDALIAEQEKLIELLKEKRQAVISHAVTKGLDPNVPMKDSGVGWLGEVPAHWEVTPLKHLVTLRSGGTPNKDRLEYWDGDLPWASAKDLKVAVLRDTQDHISQYAVDSGAAELIPAGSVLIVVRGMILARTFPVSIAAVPMAINQDLKALDCRQGIKNGFMAWLLEAAAPESSRLTDEAGHGTKALRMETWTAMRLAIPPEREQASIMAFLHHETSAIDALIDNAIYAIGVLGERRAALISAAVTGQIDVRQVWRGDIPIDVEVER